MRKETLICIVCPNGCELEAEVEETDGGIRVYGITGNLCDKGPPWAEQELINPMRTIASNVLVEKGEFPLVSVRTDAPIPRDQIYPVMEAVKNKQVRAPVKIGDVLIAGPAGCACNIIATRNVDVIGG